MMLPIENKPIPEPTMKYISPTSLRWFETTPMKFVLYYIFKVERGRQTNAMAIGSAFDSRVKGSLEADLFGVANRWEELYVKSIDDPEVRTWCLERSEWILKMYKESGAYNEILRIADKCKSARFEFDAAQEIIVDGLKIPVFGKPDGFIEMLEEFFFILDWKVNGYISNASPQAGYVRIHRVDGSTEMQHKNAQCLTMGGIKYNTNTTKTDWHDQLCIYQMMLGHGFDEAAQKRFLVGIDQLAFDREGVLRVAVHRNRLLPMHLEGLRKRLFTMWTAVQNQHYFINKTKEENDELLQRIANMDDGERWMMAQ